MYKYSPISKNSESTVVTEYLVAADRVRESAYQSEADFEHARK